MGHGVYPNTPMQANARSIVRLHGWVLVGLSETGRATTQSCDAAAFKGRGRVFCIALAGATALRLANELRLIDGPPPKS